MRRQNGPWVIEETILKYKTPWVGVFEDQVIRPDGKQGTFSVVKLLPGISILPIDEEGKVYLIKEFKYALGKEAIEAVSGGLDKREEPLEAAKRELREELGIVAKEIINLGVMHPFTNVVYAPAYLFLAKKLQFTSHKQEATEKIEMYKTTLAEAVRMVMESKVIHGPSCVLIMKVKEYLKTS